ncbi:hypothetical protein BD770DRAFT_409083 [Pilaira anomala]|nr:hypothetical protein BD770DRAFT_409083 [Pilaira anomala]
MYVVIVYLMSTACLICPAVLFELSERLQHCFSELLLATVYFVTPAGQILTQRDKAIWINMPFTNFSLLQFISLNYFYGGYTSKMILNVHVETLVKSDNLEINLSGFFIAQSFDRESYNITLSNPSHLYGFHL